MRTLRNKYKKKQLGFTLIELLLVISIIGLLATIVLSAVDTARAAAQDQRTITDIETLSQAMQLYYNDTGTYPPTNGPVASSSDLPTWNNVIGGPLVPNYIGSMPVSLGASGYYYFTAADTENVGLSLRSGLHVQICTQPNGYVLFALLSKASHNNTNSLTGTNSTVFMLGQGVTQGSC